MYIWYSQRNANNSSFWDDHWQGENLNWQMAAAKNSELIPIFKRHLPKNGKILEAGCGQGIFVNALRELGYDIEGIDFGIQTVSQINREFPNLPIKMGDIFKLPYPNNCLDAYISLGVIEHYQNNWQEPIKEASRVLKNGGFILVSVPYYNWFRRLYLPIRDLFRRRNDEFYAYVFKKNEIEDAITKAGFTVKTREFYGKASVIMSIPIIGRLVKKLYPSAKKSYPIKNNHQTKTENRSIYRKIFDLLPNSIFSHMILIVAKKI